MGIITVYNAIKSSARHRTYKGEERLMDVVRRMYSGEDSEGWNTKHEIYLSRVMLPL